MIWGNDKKKESNEKEKFKDFTREYDEMKSSVEDAFKNKIVEITKGMNKPSKMIMVKTFEDLKNLGTGLVIYHLIEHKLYIATTKDGTFAYQE